jgi:hypothetical protein
LWFFRKKTASFLSDRENNIKLAYAAALIDTRIAGIIRCGVVESVVEKS